MLSKPCILSRVVNDFNKFNNAGTHMIDLPDLII